MPHDRLTNGLRDDAALFALGMLGPKERPGYRKHLDAGRAVCEAEIGGVAELAAAVALNVSPRRPSARLRERVLGLARPSAGERRSPQVWRDWTSTVKPDLHVVRQGEGDWQPVMTGILAKQLYVDPVRDSVTMLIRMEPGAKYVPHRHGGPEQCLVLEGDLHEDDLVFRAGDFQCADTGSVHGAQWTESGCLLLIVCSQHDQMIT